MALPTTATTTLQPLTGRTPSTGALWLWSLVGRSPERAASLAGWHDPSAEPSTATTAPHAVTGTSASATWPDCDPVFVSWGHEALPVPSTSAMMSQTVTGASASTTPVCDVLPSVPLRPQSLEVSAATPASTEQILTGASALTAPSWVVAAED